MRTQFLFYPLARNNHWQIIKFILTIWSLEYKKNFNKQLNYNERWNIYSSNNIVNCLLLRVTKKYNLSVEIKVRLIK